MQHEKGLSNWDRFCNFVWAFCPRTDLANSCDVISLDTCPQRISFSLARISGIRSGMTTTDMSGGSPCVGGIYHLNRSEPDQKVFHVCQNPTLHQWKSPRGLTDTRRPSPQHCKCPKLVMIASWHEFFRTKSRFLEEVREMFGYEREVCERTVWQKRKSDKRGQSWWCLSASP